MKAKGGARAGAGRKVSATTIRTRAAAEKLAQDNGVTPLEVMVQTMRALWAEATKDDTEVDIDLAKEASEIAEKCAAYMHPRLASIEQYVDAKVRQYAVTDKPLDEDEWDRTYGPLATTSRTPESAH